MQIITYVNAICSDKVIVVNASVITKCKSQLVISSEKAGILELHFYCIFSMNTTLS